MEDMLVSWTYFPGAWYTLRRQASSLSHVKETQESIYRPQWR
jgi:hypothetical protein